MNPRILVSAATLLCAALTVVLPWGVHLPADMRFFTPLVPFAVMFAWVSRRPELMPEWLVFVAGMLIDVATHGPLGYWALVYLIGFAVATLTRPLNHRGSVGHWVGFTVTASVIGLVQWVVMTAYLVRRVEAKPVFLAVAAIVLCYPLVALVLSPLLGDRARRDNPTLSRGA